MPEVHARVSASAAHRWMACPGSVKLGETYPNGSSIYADEGTIAHLMAEGLISKDAPVAGAAYDKAKEFYAKHPELNGSADEMKEYLEPYVDFVFETFHEELHKDEAAELMTEQRVDFTDYVPDGFGTSDVVIVRNGHLHIIDLKYGKGVQVEAEHNPQLRLYALGALDRFDMVYDIETVTMTIYQPRLDHVSSDTLSAGFLKKWGEYEVKPKAEEAMYSKKPSMAAGDHCKFCPARYDCKVRAEHYTALKAYKEKLILTPEDIAEVLKQVDGLVSFADDIKSSALSKALEGEEIPGYKVVEGRSNRKYSGSEEQVVSQATGAGYDEALLYERKLLGISAMEKMMGKKQFAEVLGGLVEKPQGKPTLVPESDKRPAITRNSAAEDFADE